MMRAALQVIATTCTALIALLGVAACGGGGSGDNATYTVGGTVTGLAGSGLTIRNNSTDLVISTNGAFTFTTAVANGTTYAVTVVTQPGTPTQECAVSNGSGTVNGSNVTNVTITCMGAPLGLLLSTPATGATGVPRAVVAVVDFTTQLDATTVTASTVTLTGPAGNQPISVSVEANELTVTPASTLLPLTPYTLTIGTGLRGSGGEQLTAPQIVNFVTADHGWQTAALLETNDAGDARTPKVAFDANGNALAIWQQIDGANFGIWWNRYTADGGWGTAAPIAGGSGAGAQFPDIAFDANGDAMAVWQQPAGPHLYLSIWSSRYTVSGSWDTPVLIETGDAGNALVPHVACDAQGNALAVWYQSDGISSFNIWSNRYTIGVGWSAAQLIGNSQTVDWYYDASDPQIVMDANGNALVVWQQTADTASQIWSNRYTAGTGWGVAQTLESSRASNPQIAMDRNGNALMVWVQGDGTALYIWSNRYSASTGWGTAVPVSIGGANNPQIAFDGQGNALAAWEQSDGKHTHIWSSHYTADGVWDSPALLESGNTGDATAAQIACDASGNALVVWQQIDGTRTDIWSNRYTTGGGWNTAAMIDTNHPGEAILAQIAIDANGNALAVWQQSDGARTNIWSNAFESDNPAGVL